MKNKTLLLVLLFLVPTSLMAQHAASSGQAPHASVTSLTSKDLPEFPGKEALMIIVDYPPGAVDPIHRHNAHAFVYVLEGSIIMQVKTARLIWGGRFGVADHQFGLSEIERR